MLKTVRPTVKTRVERAWKQSSPPGQRRLETDSVRSPGERPELQRRPHYEANEPHDRHDESYPSQQPGTFPQTVQAHYRYQEQYQGDDEELGRIQPRKPEKDALLVHLGRAMRHTLVEPHNKPQQSRRQARRCAQSTQADEHIPSPWSGCVPATGLPGALVQGPRSSTAVATATFGAPPVWRGLIFCLPKGNTRSFSPCRNIILPYY